MLRGDASRMVMGVVAVAVVLSAGACLGDDESTDGGPASSIIFRTPTAVASPTRPIVRPITSPGPGEVECGRSKPWITVKNTIICLPEGTTLSTLIVDYPVGVPHEGGTMFHVIERGNSKVLIEIDSGEITKWDVAPEDEEEFRRLILEPLEEAGY